VTLHSLSLLFTAIIFNSTVYAKTAATGDDVWTSDPLDGVCEGSAHATSDGLNVFVIHNTENGTLGHFTVLDETGAVYYTYDDTVGPYAPMGFYPDPSPGGNFPNGTGNTNSFAIWGYKPTPGATDAERSGTLAFQMPISTIVASPTVTVLINATLLDWRSTAPPLLAAMGQEMFWSVTSSQLKGWTNTTFVNGPNGGANFGRGLPVWVAAPYTPAVNDIDAPTIVCGGSANSSFSCMEPTVSELFYTPSFTNDITPGLIYADPFFSTAGDRVYFFDNAGIFHSINPTDGSVFFNASTGVSIQANAAMTSDGAYIFFGDTTGNILAWQIAESTLSEVTSPPGSSGGGGETESPSSESSSPNMTPTPDGPSSPTSAPGPTSGAVSMTVFSVIAVSAVTAAATTFF
jgi:hypothetical protein